MFYVSLCLYFIISFIICQCFLQDCVKIVLCTIMLLIKESRFEARRRVYSVHSVQPEMISEILFSVGVLPDNLIPIYTYRVDKTGIKVLEIWIK